MRDVEIAYLAGLFDGEGTALVSPYSTTKYGYKYDRVVVRVTNTHRPVLEWVREKTGFGHIAPEKRLRESHKQCYRYMVANANAVSFLRIIRPFLIIKAEHVDKLLSGKISGRTEPRSSSDGQSARLIRERPDVRCIPPGPIAE